MLEEWRDVVGYEGIYQVSSLGNIKSLARFAKNRHGVRPIRERILKPALSRGDYFCVGLKKDTVSKTYFVHRLVAEAFHQNPNNKPCVNHINAIRTDNRACNLEWCTYSENNQHSYNLGNGGIAEKHRLTILTNRDVEFILIMLDAKVKQKFIASMFNVHPQIIHSIKKGLTWNSVSGKRKPLDID